jgi:hypothetical protein
VVVVVGVVSVAAMWSRIPMRVNVGQKRVEDSGFRVRGQEPPPQPSPAERGRGLPSARSENGLSPEP